MRLFAKVSDPELLLKSLNEAGTAFYRLVEGNIVEAVYFSTSRTIYFLGELTPRQYEVPEGSGLPRRADQRRRAARNHHGRPAGG